jgi:hypothetical protein
VTLCLPLGAQMYGPKGRGAEQQSDGKGVAGDHTDGRSRRGGEVLLQRRVCLRDTLLLNGTNALWQRTWKYVI